MLTESDLKVGHVYAAKEPAETQFSYYNDVLIKGIDGDGVEYYLPPHYGYATVEQFISMIDRDVTAEMPEGGWRKWKGDA